MDPLLSHDQIVTGSALLLSAIAAKRNVTYIVCLENMVLSTNISNRLEWIHNSFFIDGHPLDFLG